MGPCPNAGPGRYEGQPTPCLAAKLDGEMPDAEFGSSEAGGWLGFYRWDPTDPSELEGICGACEARLRRSALLGPMLAVACQEDSLGFYSVVEWYSSEADLQAALRYAESVEAEDLEAA